MINRMCKYYSQGKCRNTRCNYPHPPDFCYYNYAEDVDIHPDLLRLAVMADEKMAMEADEAFIQNYLTYHSKYSKWLKGYKISYEDLCVPFNPERVYAEISNKMGKQQQPFYSQNSEANSSRNNYSRDRNHSNYRRNDQEDFQRKRNQY